MKKSIKIVALVAVLTVFGASIEARSLVRSLDRLLNLYDKQALPRRKRVVLKSQLTSNKTAATITPSVQAVDIAEGKEEVNIKWGLSDEIRKELVRDLHDKLSETLRFYEDGEDEGFELFCKRADGLKHFTVLIQMELFLQEALDVARKDLMHKDPKIVLLAGKLCNVLVKNDVFIEEIGELATSYVQNILDMPAELDAEESRSLEWRAYLVLSELLPELLRHGYSVHSIRDLVTKAATYKHHDIAEAAQRLKELIGDIPDSTSQEQ